MKRFKGKKESLKKLGIIFLVTLAFTIVTVLFVPNMVLKVILALIEIIFLMETYKGLIISITFDKEQVRIFHPFSFRTIKFDDVAFCAVHGIDENRILIYAFVRKRFFGREYVKGIKSKKSFDEVVQLISQDDGDTNLDINFNMAAKIPISFVEGNDELKDLILQAVDERHRHRV